MVDAGLFQGQASDDSCAPPVVLAVGLSASTMDTLLHTLDNRKVVARVEGIAMTRVGTGAMDITGMASHSNQVWGSRTMAKADELSPLGAPVWIKSPESQYLGSVLGVACRAALAGALEHPPVKVLLPAGSTIALRAIC